MRSLHPVGVHEKFVASGVYQHYENDEATGTIENWSIHELPDGAQIIRVDEDWRKKDGSSVLIEGWRNPKGILERFDIHGFGGKNDEIKTVRAAYTLNPPYLEIGRNINKGEREQMEIQLPESYILSPKSLIFSGLEVAQLAKLGHPEAIITYFPIFSDEQAAFKPVAYRQEAIHEKDEIILDLADKAYNARKYLHRTPATGVESSVWLDKHDILIKFSSADGIHSAILSRYAHRPEPKEE